MKKILSVIVKRRFWVFLLTAVLLHLCVAGAVFSFAQNKINSNMMTYLPEDVETTESLNFLKENFNIDGNAFVVVEGTENDEKLYEKAEKLRKIDGMSQFLWIGDVEELEKTADNPLLSALTESLNFDFEELKNYLKRPVENSENYNYVFLMLFDCDAASDEAYDILFTVRREFSDRNYGISGMTALSNQILTQTLKELPMYIVLAVLAVLIILILFSSSFFEPFIVVATLGTSILLNLGSNYLFPSVSIISYAACSVIQLAVCTDYAVIYMHFYKKRREKSLSFDASVNAVFDSLPTILTGAITTACGFAVLFLMKFTIGADIAKVALKGIALSLLTVIILEPCLVKLFDRLLQKTTHRELHLDYGKVAGFTVKNRIVAVIIMLCLFAPAFYGQFSVNFSYLKIYESKENQSSAEVLAERLGNQVIVAVPLLPKDGTQKDFMEELCEIDKIERAVGAYSGISAMESDLVKLLNALKVGEVDYSDSPLKALTTLFAKKDGEWYTMYLLETNGDTEGKEALEAAEHVKKTGGKYFDENYTFGLLTGVYDMSKITFSDFAIVFGISAAVIFLILTLAFKSPLKSFLSVALIVLAVAINVSLGVLFKVGINFLVYILISSVQLGCTVDYAVLMISSFDRLQKEGLSGKEASVSAAREAFKQITVGAAIITFCCLSIALVSKNILVRQMGELLSRGSLISYVVVLLFLPPLLSFINRPPTLCAKLKSIIKKG